MVKGFTTTNRYFDNKHYPRGFSHHGDFAIKETQLLERHGYTFNELDPGRREPATREEELPVAARHGERGPVTEVEHVWSKYMIRIKRPKRFHTLSGGKPRVEGAEDYTDPDD